MIIIKDLAKRTVSDMILKDKAYKIALNLKVNGYQIGLASMVYTFSESRARSKARANVKKVLAQELLKPVIKKFKRKKSLCEV